MAHGATRTEFFHGRAQMVVVDRGCPLRGAEFTLPTDVTGSKIARLNDTCGNLIQVKQLLRC